jgi:3-oxoacyl-[acyl-carrier-protein] synthase II
VLATLKSGCDKALASLRPHAATAGKAAHLANLRIFIQFASTQKIWEIWCGASLTAPPSPPHDYGCHRAHLLHAARTLSPCCDPTRTPLILATTKGPIDALVSWMRAEHPDGPVPTLSDEAASLARDLHLAGPAYAVSAACASGLFALIDAAVTLRQEQAPAALVLGIDVASSFVRDGFGALKAASPTGICRPFDSQRDGLILGSGAAAALVTGQPAGSATCLLSGWGAASDAVHLTAPDRDASGLIRAIQQALDMARLAPHEIDVVFAHGTGTRYNDAMEAVALEKLFLPSGRKSPAITAVKGLIGHTLGASGIVETALAAHILATQMVPAITNLQTSEYPQFDFVQAPRHTPVRHILKVASGFGGLNAAVILSHPGAA